MMFWSVSRLRSDPEPRRVSKRPGVTLPRWRERSRFVGWQFYPLAAGGSRKLSSEWQIYGPRGLCKNVRYRVSDGTGRWVILGSRLLHTYRTAGIQSGSPPAPGGAQRQFVGQRHLPVPSPLLLILSPRRVTL